MFSCTCVNEMDLMTHELEENVSAPASVVAKRNFAQNIHSTICVRALILCLFKIFGMKITCFVNT